MYRLYCGATMANTHTHTHTLTTPPPPPHTLLWSFFFLCVCACVCCACVCAAVRCPPCSPPEKTKDDLARTYITYNITYNIQHTLTHIDIQHTTHIIIQHARQQPRHPPSKTQPPPYTSAAPTCVRRGEGMDRVQRCWERFEGVSGACVERVSRDDPRARAFQARGSRNKDEEASLRVEWRVIHVNVRREHNNGRVKNSGWRTNHACASLLRKKFSFPFSWLVLVPLSYFPLVG